MSVGGRGHVIACVLQAAAAEGKGEGLTLCANRTVSAGDRIAQLVLERIATPEVQQVQVSPPLSVPVFFGAGKDADGVHAQSLDETLRGAGGFGSTGGFGAGAAAAEKTEAKDSEGVPV